MLCDENVPSETVGHLEADGHEATHVRDAPGPGATDPTVAEHARDGGYLLLTNDTDFLDPDAYPGLTVLYVPDNRTEAHALASMVGRLEETIADPERLPRTVLLTQDE